MAISRSTSFLILVFVHTLFAQTINYAQHDLHTQVIAKNQTELSLEYTLINDTVDVFNLKQSEFSNTSSIGSMGDSDSLGIGIRYGLSDTMMLSIKHSKRNIKYISETLTNQKSDIFLRYNIFHYDGAFFNSGVSVDVGYTRNKLKNFYLRKSTSINKMIKRILPNANAALLYSDGINPFKGEPFARPEGYYARFNNTTTALTQDPYVSLIKTQDDSFYTRVLTGFHTDESITDFYAGYKYTSIKNTITTTQEILSLAQNEGIDLKKILDRDEAMLFLGFNYSINVDKFIYEFSYEYDHFLRDGGLGYVNYNHIFNAHISYILRKDLLISVGGKILYRQLNGEIPYLYNKYTQTTFDHKYGYATLGLQYRF